mmetsp:Transcript_1670/g.2669  ORF Transcript_1670/g.2669 Transcript_1670/m.2669 type:complete len:132 (-) Transcript_1670:18-413(-)
MKALVSFVGAEVGRFVGELVGLLVGEIVGLIAGEKVGNPVGVSLPTMLGAIDGSVIATEPALLMLGGTVSMLLPGAAVDPSEVESTALEELLLLPLKPTERPTTHITITIDMAPKSMYILFRDLDRSDKSS